MLLDGKGVREVAGLLKVSKSAVSRWKQTVERKGLDGLASKPHPGPAPRLSPTQKERLKKLLIGGAIALMIGSRQATTYIARAVGALFLLAVVGGLAT